MGGDWHDLGGQGGGAPLLQPLAAIDDLDERAWATNWLAALLAREGAQITPQVRDHLWSALGALASAPVEERTLSGLAALLQVGALKLALQPYCVGGAAGRLLDAERESLGAGDIQAFETEGLIGSPGAPAVLAYLFHRIEHRLDGRPTLVIVDEGCRRNIRHRAEARASRLEPHGISPYIMENQRTWPWRSPHLPPPLPGNPRRSGSNCGSPPRPRI